MSSIELYFYMSYSYMLVTMRPGCHVFYRTLFLHELFVHVVYLDDLSPALFCDHIQMKIV